MSETNSAREGRSGTKKFGINKLKCEEGVSWGQIGRYVWAIYESTLCSHFQKSSRVFKTSTILTKLEKFELNIDYCSICLKKEDFNVEGEYRSSLNAYDFNALWRLSGFPDQFFLNEIGFRNR